ncbi:MAG TPA: hypothetical protein VGC46_04160 [Allosphingosinicella sp.]
MDINYFLEREQVERHRADAAECDEAREAHLGLADGYRRMIDSHRSDPEPAARA